MPFLETLYYFVSNEELDGYLKGLLGVDLNWARDIKRPGKLEKVASAVIAFFHDNCPELQSRLSKPEAGKDRDTWFAHFEVDIRRFADLVIEEITNRPKFIEGVGKFTDKRLVEIAKKLLAPGKKETLHIPRQQLNQIAYSVNPSYTQLKKLGNDWVKRLEKRAQGEAKQIAQQEQARRRKESLPLIEPAKLGNPEKKVLALCYSNVIYHMFSNVERILEGLSNTEDLTETTGQNEIERTLIRLLLGLQELKQTGEVIPYEYWKPLHDHFKDRYPLRQHHCALSYWRDLVQSSPKLARYFNIKYIRKCGCTGRKGSIKEQWPSVLWTQSDDEVPQTFQSKLITLMEDQSRPASPCSDCHQSYELTAWKAPQILNVQIGALGSKGDKTLQLEGDIPFKLTIAIGNASRPVSYELQSVIFHCGTVDQGHYTSCSKRGGRWFLCNDEVVLKQSEFQINRLLNEKFRLEDKRVAQLVYERVDDSRRKDR